ncbi:MAG: hypothetical protein KTR28_07070 [Micavibrio sp.]|nr:hypothetical protein [Micavibrio sp.]
MKTINSQRGSAIFMILIAIALFAALSFAVGNMMRGGNSDMLTEERAALTANGILDYAALLKRTIQDLRISNACEDTDISFANTTVAGFTNGANVSCQVFHSSGGAAKYTAPAADAGTATEWTFTGHHSIHQVGGTPNASDLLMILPNVNDAVCSQINQKLGRAQSITGSGTTSVSSAKFTGTYTSGPHIGNDPPFEMNGFMSACFTLGGVNYFYSVLIAR